MAALMHFGARLELMKRMARTVGADIIAAVAARRVGSLDLREAALRCANCRHAGACVAWLDAHADMGVVPPPAFCSNAELMCRAGGRPDVTHCTEMTENPAS